MPETKHILAAICAAAVLGSGWFLLRPKAKTAGPEPQDLKPEWTAVANSNAVDVFQRAFWRRPGEDDKILHAERIEWSDPQQGVAKWQWFLEVEASPALKTWLQQKNPFWTAKAASYAAATDSKNTRRPAWFPESATDDDFEIQRTGSMTFLFSRSSQTIFATASGNGFQPGLSQR